MAKAGATAIFGWVITAAVFGCGADTGEDGPGNADTEAPGTGTTQAPVTSSGSSGDSTTQAGAEDGTSSGGENRGSSGEGSSGEQPAPAADGESCSSARGCLSGACYDVGILGGICGACASSADCDAGCRPPDPFGDPRRPSACERRGTHGSACESAADCDGAAVCSTVFVLPGVFDVRGCGACETAIDCARGERCSPTYDLPGLGGSRSCVAPGTLRDGAHCDPQDGADACINTCQSVEFEGLATLGVCSMCGADGDCDPKTEVCAPAELVDGELQPAACVPAKTPR